MLRSDDKRAGLTALELLIAVTLIAIVSSAGVPMLRDLVLNAQRRSDLDTLLGAVDLARTAALTRRTATVLCQSADLQTCAATQTDGKRWIVTVQAQPDAPPAPAIPLQRITLRSAAATVTGNRETWQFRPFPQRSTNGTVNFCDPRGGTAQRAIVISPTGRPRLIAPPDANGFPACATD